MGWESVYYAPGEANSVKAKVFDHFKPLSQAKTELAKETDLWKHLSRDNMARIISCTLKLLEAVQDTKYNVFKDREAMKMLVTSFTNILPSTSPAGLTDFVTMAADKALEYLELYSTAVEKTTFTHYTDQQKAVISYADFDAHADMTISKWADDILWTAELSMETLRHLGAERSKTTLGFILKESPASKVSEKNLYALRDYFTYRQYLYTWFAHGAKTKVSDTAPRGHK
jgi:hypothetical protein